MLSKTGLATLAALLATRPGAGARFAGARLVAGATGRAAAGAPEARTRWSMISPMKLVSTTSAANGAGATLAATLFKVTARQACGMALASLARRSASAPAKTGSQQAR